MTTMTSGEHVEMAIRAAQISSTLLGLLESKGIQGARLRFVMAVKQLKELDALLEKIEGPNTQLHRRGGGPDVEPAAGTTSGGSACSGSIEKGA